MLSVIVNTLTVIVGSLLGMLLKRGVPKRITDVLMDGIGLCTVAIGVEGVMKGTNDLVMILSICFGAIIGTLLDLDGKLTKLSEWVERKFPQREGSVPVAVGFMTASMLFCIGSMTIVGSLQAGLTGDGTMIYTKSILDLISSFTLATSMGLGVLLASVFVFVFQGALVLCSSLVAGFFTDYVVASITCVGSVAIIGLGLNLLGLKQIKTANFLPAIFLPILFCLILK